MSIVLPAVSTGHPSIYGFSALLTVYSFPLIGLTICFRRCLFNSILITAYSFLFRVTVAHSAAPAAAPCTATDCRSSLRARRLSLVALSSSLAPSSSPIHSYSGSVLINVNPGLRRCPPLPAPAVGRRRSIPHARCPPALPFAFHHRPLALNLIFLRALFPPHSFIISVTVHTCILRLKYIIYDKMYNTKKKKKKNRQHWLLFPHTRPDGSEYTSMVHQCRAQIRARSCGLIIAAGATSIATSAALVAVIKGQGKSRMEEPALVLMLYLYLASVRSLLYSMLSALGFVLALACSSYWLVLSLCWHSSCWHRRAGVHRAGVVLAFVGLASRRAGVRHTGVALCVGVIVLASLCWHLLAGSQSNGMLLLLVCTPRRRGWVMVPLVVLLFVVSSSGSWCCWC
jgi:hypothetical protein